MKNQTTWVFEKLKDTANYRVFAATEKCRPDFNKIYVSKKDAVAKHDRIEVVVRSIE